MSELTGPPPGGLRRPLWRRWLVPLGLAGGVAVLLATTWSRMSPPERLARSLILAVLVLVTIGVALR